MASAYCAEPFHTNTAHSLSSGLIESLDLERNPLLRISSFDLEMFLQGLFVIIFFSIDPWFYCNDLPERLSSGRLTNLSICCLGLKHKSNGFCPARPAASILHRNVSGCLPCCAPLSYLWTTIKSCLAASQQIIQKSRELCKIIPKALLPQKLGDYSSRADPSIEIHYEIQIFRNKVADSCSHPHGRDTTRRVAVIPESVRVLTRVFRSGTSKRDIAGGTRALPPQSSRNYQRADWPTPSSRRPASGSNLFLPPSPSSLIGRDTLGALR